MPDITLLYNSFLSDFSNCPTLIYSDNTNLIHVKELREYPWLKKRYCNMRLNYREEKISFSEAEELYT